MLVKRIFHSQTKLLKYGLTMLRINFFCNCTVFFLYLPELSDQLNFLKYSFKNYKFSMKYAKKN